MIHLLYGADTFSLREFLMGLVEAVGLPEVRDANTSVVEGQDATPGVLLGLCCAAPFLAERRLVIVRGLLGLAERQDRQEEQRRGEGRQRADQRVAARWRGFGDHLASIPPTTDLVFQDGPLTARNPLLRELSAAAQVREFRPLDREGLRAWARGRAASGGSELSPGATALLVDLVGPDLWALGSEVEKLSLYAEGRAIREDDVRRLVSQAREESIFAAVDAVIEGSHQRAVPLAHRLMEGGDTAPQRLLAMVARQVRQLMLAQELLRQGATPEEVGQRLGIASAYPLRKTLEQARMSAPETLRRLHAALLETDVAIKSGAQEERLAVEALVATACTLARRPRSRPAGGG